MARFFVLISAFAAVYALTGFSLSPAAPPPNDKEKEQLYFPVRVGDTAVYTEGDKEFTETVTKVEDVEGTKVVSVDRAFGGKVITRNYQRVNVSTKGIALVELYNTKFDPLLWELKLPAKVGSEWKFERASDTGPYFDVRIIDAIEAVEVPAGKYMAVKVVRSRTLDNRQVGVKWFAPKVGLVKSEYRTETKGLETKVLKSFTAGNGRP